MKKPAWGKKRKPGERNKLETKFEAEILEPRRLAGEVIWHRYESMRLRIVDRDLLTTYTPDFPTQLESGEIVLYEVKGYLDIGGDAWLKLKLVADQYPFRVILAQHRNKAEGWTFRDV